MQKAGVGVEPRVQFTVSLVLLADAGTRHSSTLKAIQLFTSGKQLVLHHQGAQIVLEKCGTDCFYVNHPDFDRFLLKFERTETLDGSPGNVVEAFYEVVGLAYRR